MGRAVLAYLALMFFAVLPAWAVQTAPMSGRILWAFLAVFALGLIGVGRLSAQTAQLESRASPFAHQHWRKFAAAFAVPLLVAELLAIAAIRATLGQDHGAKVFEGLAKLGIALFPVVEKFATEMAPPLAPGLLLQAQAVFTAFLLASFSTAAAIAFLVLLLRPSQPSDDIWERPPRLDLADLFPPVFALLAVAALFGWSDFEKEGMNSKGSDILNAYVYLAADNQLLLVGAAIARYLMVLLTLLLLVLWWLRLKARHRQGTAKN